MSPDIAQRPLGGGEQNHSLLGSPDTDTRVIHVSCLEEGHQQWCEHGPACSPLTF